MSGYMFSRVLVLVRPWVVEIGDMEMANRLLSLQQENRALSDAFLSGEDEREHKKRTQRLARDIWSLVDEAYLRKRLRENTSFEYVEMLRPLDEPSSPESAFKYFWLTKLSEADCELLNSFIQSPDMEDEALMGISGLTLNLVRSFSLPGILCLIHAAEERHAECIRERAWVGLVLVLYVHDNHMAVYPEIQDAISELTSTEDGRVFAATTLSCLLRLGGMKWVNDISNKLQADIMPLATKITDQANINIVNLNELETMEDMISDDVMDRLKMHHQAMAKMHDLQMDTQYSMFKDMYRTPFFVEPYRWWLPYAPDYLPENMRGGEKFLNMLPHEDMCDSDMYAFISSMTQFKVVNGMNVDQLDVPEEAPQTNSNKLLMHDYVRQLYRFYTLNPWKVEYPFEGFGDFTVSHIFDWLTPSVAEKNIMLDHCMQFHAWEMVTMLAPVVAKRKETASLHASCGYAYQMRSFWDLAIREYTKALAIENNARVWRRLAMCYMQEDQYENALMAFEHALEQDADNKAVLVEKAACLEQLELYGEALEIYFKLDLYYPNWPRVESAIAWCSVLADDYDTAARYFLKRVSADPPAVEDIQHYGTFCFIQGRRMEALQAYQQAQRMDTDMMAYVTRMRRDRKFLLEKGISKEDIYQMEDILMTINS